MTPEVVEVTKVEVPAPVAPPKPAKPENPFRESELVLLNDLSDMFKEGFGNRIKLIKDHYKNTQKDDDWVQKLTENDSVCDLILNLKGIDTSRFDSEHSVLVTFEGPDESVYALQDYDLEVKMPEQWPKAPFLCYLKQKIFHINVHRSAEATEKKYQVIVNSLAQDWDPAMPVVSAVMAVMEALAKPEAEKCYFVNNKSIYNEYKKVPGSYRKSAAK